MLSMLFYPFKYLGISWESPNSSRNQKLWIDLYLPLIVSSFSFLVWWRFGVEHSPYFFNSTAFDVIINFLQTLPGFYLAALAVIASLNNGFLDELTYGEGPIDTNNEEMSRRRFLTNCVSYLAVLSMFLIGLSSCIKYLDQINVLGSFAVEYRPILYGLCISLFVFLLVQLFFITLLCLYYLGDRLHRAN